MSLKSLNFDPEELFDNNNIIAKEGFFNLLKKLSEEEKEELKIYIKNKKHSDSVRYLGYYEDYQQHLTTPTTTLSNPPPPSTTQEEDLFLIKSLLSKGRPKIDQLKYGIHNGVYYFGTIMYQGFSPKTAVITSNKKVYVNWGYKEGQRNQIKEDFGLFYRYDFEYEVLDNHWSTDGITSFIEEDKHISIKECYDKLFSVNKEFMYYHNEVSHKVIALDIIGSYFQPCFEANGRTFLEAEQGSGKTRQCTIYKKTACNSVMSADISKSSFFRIMESTCGTLIIDDFDSIGDEQKTDILQHYKTGYKNSSKSVRTGEGKNRKLEAFRNYGHTIMNNTTGLDNISSDRTKFIPILKYDGELTIKNIEENNPRWEKLTDMLYIMALQNWKKVQEIYDNCNSKEFSGRKFELIRPILAIAEIISENLKKEVEGFFKETFEQSSMIDTENDWEYIALEMFKENIKGDTKKLSDMAECIFDRTEDLDSKDRKKRVRGISVYIGKMFKRLAGVFRVKMIKGIRHVELSSRKRYEDYIRLKGWHRVAEGGIDIEVSPKEEEVV